MRWAKSRTARTPHANSLRETNTSDCVCVHALLWLAEPRRASAPVRPSAPDIVVSYSPYYCLPFSAASTLDRLVDDAGNYNVTLTTETHKCLPSLHHGSDAAQVLLKQLLFTSPADVHYIPVRELVLSSRRRRSQAAQAEKPRKVRQRYGYTQYAVVRCYALRYGYPVGHVEARRCL